MRVAGFVSELNPFHNGHAYFIEQVRRAGATHVVSVMSGSFVQRGEAAFADKFLRAEAAVKSGVDLVLDLPVPWALGSAESFARGGVSLLGRFGCNLLAFGCETEETALLQHAAALLSDPDLLDAAAAFMKSGLHYPSAVGQALLQKGEDDVAALLRTPNNILAVEYLRALQMLSFNMTVCPVKRAGASHDASLSKGTIQSASAIRSLQALPAMQPYLPESAYRVYGENEGRLLDYKSFETAVLTALRLLPHDAFSVYVTENSGLADRLKKAVQQATGLPHLYDLVKTKSLTHARIRRETMHLFLQIPPSFEKETPPYARVLAANSRGRELLSLRRCSLPVITKHAETAKLDAHAQALYELQCRASDLYALCTKEKRACCTEQQSSVRFI